jgi:hypothetical protein
VLNLSFFFFLNDRSAKRGVARRGGRGGRRGGNRSGPRATPKSADELNAELDSYMMDSTPTAAGGSTEVCKIVFRISFLVT